MTEMFGEAWSPMSVPDLAPDDDDDVWINTITGMSQYYFLPDPKRNVIEQLPTYPTHKHT